MPRNRIQRTVFAFLTVLVTVHAYVFYSLYVVNGSALMAATQTTGVLAAIRKQGGVFLCGTPVPIWAVIAIEFLLAFSLEMLLGSPLSFRLTLRIFDPKTTHPVLFESGIICATVAIMCPAMSFIAAWLYYPYYAGFSLITLFANWFRLICYNFPFAFFSQLFLIQPLIRTIFRAIFRRDLAAQKKEAA